eukprot:g10720.t1
MSRPSIQPLDPRWLACACLVHPAIEILDCTGVPLKAESLTLISGTLILDKNPVLESRDLTCLADIEPLEKLEVSHCGNLVHLTPLENCPRLLEVVARHCDRLGEVEGEKVGGQPGSGSSFSPFGSSLGGMPSRTVEDEDSGLEIEMVSVSKKYEGINQWNNSTSGTADGGEPRKGNLHLTLLPTETHEPHLVEKETFRSTSLIGEAGGGMLTMSSKWGLKKGNLMSRSAGAAEVKMKHKKWWERALSQTELDKQLVADYVKGKIHYDSVKNPQNDPKEEVDYCQEDASSKPQSRGMKILTSPTSKAVKIRSSRAGSKLRSGDRSLAQGRDFSGNQSAQPPDRVTEKPQDHHQPLLRSKTVKIVNVEGCSELRNVNMVTVVEQFDLSHLKNFRCLGGGFRQLRLLDVSYSPSVTEINFKTFFEAAPCLKSVNGSHCDSLSNVNVQQGVFLETLVLNNCARLRTLGENFFPSNVRYVDCFRCHALREEEIWKVLAANGDGHGLLGDQGLLEDRNVSKERRASKASSLLGGSLAGAGGALDGSKQGGHHVPLDVVLLEEFPHARKGSLCKLLDCWLKSFDDLDTTASGGGGERLGNAAASRRKDQDQAWQYLLSVTWSPPPGFTKNQKKNQKKNCAEIVVDADRLGSAFDFVPFENRTFDFGKRISNMAAVGTMNVPPGMVNVSSECGESVNSESLSPMGVLRIGSAMLQSPAGGQQQMLNSGGYYSPSGCSSRSSKTPPFRAKAGGLAAGIRGNARRGSVFARARCQSPLFVWPGDNGNNYYTAVTTQNAARAKWWKACQQGQKLADLEEEAGFGGNRNDVHTIARHCDDVVKELVDALRVLQQAGVRDLPLLLPGLKLLREWAPDTPVDNYIANRNTTAGKIFAEMADRSVRRSLDSARVLPQYDVQTGAGVLSLPVFGRGKPEPALLVPVLKGVPAPEYDLFHRTLT